ncbi:MAG: family 16 glycosylhydrolase [Candidatus Omnitrophica bacterium]|nr:family 16 glycosylhydrolase [Candidatus Omnitrophota bacterium]
MSARILIAVFGGIFACAAAVPVRATPEQPASAAELPGWYMVWNDEFDGEAVDLHKWRIEDAALVKNNEQQYYAPDEVYVQDGRLTLRSRQREMGGRPYTSGLVETRGKASWQYGRFEIRAKLPAGKGLWPAHWMLPASGFWPPEIDIMEMLGHMPKVIHMTVHWGVWPKKKQRGFLWHGEDDFSAGFHVFALEWDERELRWYIDGALRARQSAYVPQEPFYLILNTAVGGNWPGNPTPRTVFPQYHEIDYVRVYAREIPGTYFLTVDEGEGRTSVSPSRQRYAAGAVVEVEALPRVGQVFSHWGGDAAGRENPLRLTMDGHKRIRAHYLRTNAVYPLLSSGRSATASSWQGRNLSPAAAVDGDLRSRWEAKAKDPAWLQVDLERVCSIAAVRLQWWEQMFARCYEIQVSDDARQWRTIARRSSGNGGTEDLTQLQARGRYVCVYITERNTDEGCSLAEFQVFGPPVAE